MNSEICSGLMRYYRQIGKTTSEWQNEISGESWKNICTEVVFYVDENGCIPYNLFCGLKRRTLKLLDFNAIKQKRKETTNTKNEM